MKILTFPDPRLLSRCLPVEIVPGTEIIASMFKLMELGLAAPQVGILERFFVMPIGVVLINPNILETCGSVTYVECCSSIPGFSVEVTRARHVVIEALDMEGRLLIHRFRGLSARVAQHEIDHLDGRLINA